MIAKHWVVWQVVILLGCGVIASIAAVGLAWFCIATFRETWARPRRPN